MTTLIALKWIHYDFFYKVDKFSILVIKSNEIMMLPQDDIVVPHLHNLSQLL